MADAVEEDENSHGLIVLERRTLVCYDNRQQVVDALNAAERGMEEHLDHGN